MKSQVKSATICDLDETLYPGSTIKDVGAWLVKNHYLGSLAYAKVLWWLVLRQLGQLDHDAAFREGVKLLAGWRERELEERMEAAYHAVIKPRLKPALYSLIKEWKKSGPVIIATESLSAIAQPLAADLKLDAVLGTELEVVRGRLTGRLAGPVLVGRAKNTAVTAWARVHGVNLRKSLTVGGRIEDVPLLHLSERALVLNPDDQTRNMARAAGWQFLEI